MYSVCSGPKMEFDAFSWNQLVWILLFTNAESVDSQRCPPHALSRWGAHVAKKWLVVYICTGLAPFNAFGRYIFGYRCTLSPVNRPVDDFSLVPHRNDIFHGICNRFPPKGSQDALMCEATRCSVLATPSSIQFAVDTRMFDQGPSLPQIYSIKISLDQISDVYGRRKHFAHTLGWRRR